jgi:hypothetical protein
MANRIPEVAPNTVGCSNVDLHDRNLSRKKLHCKFDRKPRRAMSIIRIRMVQGLRGRLDKLANRFGVLRVCRRLHRAIWLAAGSLRFKIAASTFLDRKIIQETRLRGW